MGNKLEEIQGVGDRPRETLAYNQFCIPATLHPLLKVLARLVFLSNKDLKPAHWGMVLMIFAEYKNFPCRVGTFRNATGLSLRPFWKILRVLRDRKIIELPYSTNSPFFSAGFPGIYPAPRVGVVGLLTPAEKAGVTWPSPAEKAGVELRPKRPELTPELRPNEPELAQVLPIRPEFPLGGGGVCISDTPPPQTAKAALEGFPGEILAGLFPKFYLAAVLPHFADARTFCPEDPVGRFRGAIFYLGRRALDGEKFKAPLGLLRKAIREGLVCSEEDYLSKKRPSNAKSEKPQVDHEAERQNRDLLNKYADRSFEEIKLEVMAHPFFHRNKALLLKNFEHLLSKSPHLEAFKEWAKKEAV